ncbi:MAG: C1 family peptidase [Halobacteriovoraceae bacterium]|nr:C1 family peptidase [Halobacteriovoraceae bacterium]
MTHALKAIALIFGLSVSNAFANEGAYLDPAYKNLVHPIVNDLENKDGFSVSKTEDLIAKMTPVKSQASRGTCSIFSGIALLEAMLVIKKDFPLDTDLSEEYLEYLIMRTSTGEGSSSWANFNAIRRHGVPTEKTFPYLGITWDEDTTTPLAIERCGSYTGNKKKSCLLGHRSPDLLAASEQQLNGQAEGNLLYDPEFLNARTEAVTFRNKFVRFTSTSYSLWSTSQAKQFLIAGTPLTMGIEFYYGAWNHSKAPTYNIGRDNEAWANGLVGFPEPGSADAVESPKHRAGHSILIVGYDDDKIVETTVKMADGSMKTFKYRGVYYFKNSWGTGSFGRNFTLGDTNYPGYGMITQKYAHQYGSFYRMPLK